MTFPTAEDIEIYDSSIGFTSGVVFSLEITSHSKQKFESLKQQILSDHIKAEKYDSLMKANSEIVQHNIDITKDHEIVERLKSKINDVERALEHLNKNYPNDREEQKQLDWILLKNLKLILENN